MWLFPPTQNVTFSRTCVTPFAPNPLCAGQTSPKVKFCFLPHGPFNPHFKTSKPEKFLILLVPEQGQSVSSVSIQISQVKSYQIKIAECWWKIWFHFYSKKKINLLTYSWLVSSHHYKLIKKFSLGWCILYMRKHGDSIFLIHLCPACTVLCFLPLYPFFSPAPRNNVLVTPVLPALMGREVLCNED